MSLFAPPPLPLVVVALSKNNQGITVLQAKLVAVLCLVVKHRVHLAVVHYPELLLDTCGEGIKLEIAR